MNPAEQAQMNRIIEKKQVRRLPLAVLFAFASAPIMLARIIPAPYYWSFRFWFGVLILVMIDARLLEDVLESRGEVLHLVL